MFRDIKLNPQQLTARQLEKQCEKYKKYLEMYDEKVPTKETKTEELKTEASEEKTNEEEDASLLDSLFVPIRKAIQQTRKKMLYPS